MARELPADDRQEAMARVRDLMETELSAAQASEMRRLLDNLPDLWHKVNVAHMAARVAVEAVTEPTGTRELLMANYEGMRRELGRAEATPLEKALIDHVALCWWRLQSVEQTYSKVMSQSVTLTLGRYWEKRLSAVQHRFLRACTTLARIRKMGLPALQVNIAADGGQQVNVQGSIQGGRSGPGRKR